MDIWDKIVHGKCNCVPWAPYSPTPPPFLRVVPVTLRWYITYTCCQTWKLHQFYLRKAINVGCVRLGSHYWLVVPGPIIHNAARSTISGILVNTAPDLKSTWRDLLNPRTEHADGRCVDTEDGAGDEQLSSHWVSGIFSNVGAQRKCANLSPHLTSTVAPSQTVPLAWHSFAQ